MFLNNLQRRHFSLSLQKFENTKQARGLETRQTLNLTLTQLHMLLNIDCKLLTNQNFIVSLKYLNGGYHVHLTIKALGSLCSLLMLFLVSMFLQLSVYTFSKLQHICKHLC